MGWKKRGIQEEREFTNMSCTDQTHCERVAGSGSRFKSVCDAILFTKRLTALVEIKTIKDPVFYVRKDIKEQLIKLIEISTKIQQIPMLVIKFKHLGWYYIFLKNTLPNTLRPNDMEKYNPIEISKKTIGGGLNEKSYS